MPGVPGRMLSTGVPPLPTTGTPWVVTMSAASLKFFDDFCVAIAWLQANGYSIETASDYVSMLKYRTRAAVGGRARGRR